MRLARTVVVAFTLVAAVPGASAESRHPGCKVPRGAGVVTKSKYAVVYDVDAEHRYGCLFSLGRRALLFDAESPLLLAGRFVAYEQVSYDPDGSVYYFLTVFDLRRRAARSFSSLYENRPPTRLTRESQDSGMATDLVLKKNGSVAWISCSPNFATAPQSDCYTDPYLPTEVWRTDRRGTKLLDASADVGPRSLKRRGSTITWRDGSATRTAKLK